MEFNGSKHLILKDDDIVGILETDEIKDLKPLNDRVLIKVCLPWKHVCRVLLGLSFSKEIINPYSNLAAEQHTNLNCEVQHKK